MSIYPDPEVLAALGRASTYAGVDPGSPVEWIQTHLSHVFLTSDRVYKFRKPVRLGFVDFSSLEERNADCLREVALNRRLAPDVYLGVAALETGAGGPRVGEAGEDLVAGHEHCVVMRRLPTGRDAASLLDRGRLDGDAIDRVALLVAVFHARVALGVPAPFSRDEWLERCTRPLSDSLALLEEHEAELGLPGLARIRQRALHFEREHGVERFERRRRAGRAVDAHGDLHLQHLWFESGDAPPIAIDCLEFDRGLRRIDAAAEVAFPAMDLRYRGRADLAERLLRVYAGERDDFDLYGVIGYFGAYRAAVRAKVAAIAAGDEGISPPQREAAVGSVRRHLELADRLLAPRPTGTLVLVGGVVGTGKSTAARLLTEALDVRGGAAVVAADRLRKQQVGLDPHARAGAGRDQGLYRPEMVAATYRGIIERAGPILESGRAAILDATWSAASDRARARVVARNLGARTFFVETRCGDAEARERLARRAALGVDPSDAGPDFHRISRDRFEAIRADEGFDAFVLETDASDWRAGIAAIGTAVARD